MSRTDDIYTFIKRFIQDTGIPPTRREIAKEFNTSTSVADYHLKSLAANGRIKLIPDTARGIVITENQSRGTVDSVATAQQGQSVVGEDDTIEVNEDGQ